MLRSRNIPKIQRSDSLQAELRNKIVNNANKLWIPPIVMYDNIDNNSCFDMKVLDNPHISQSTLVFNNVNLKVENKVTKCERIFLKPSSRQARIMTLWFDACTEMYNSTIQHIKSSINFNKLPVLKKLRTLINNSILVQINDLEKEIKSNQTIKNRLLQYIRSDRARTKTNIKTFNNKMKQYVNLKNIISGFNIELNLLKNKLTKCNRIYNDTYNKIKDNVNYKYVRTYVLKDIRNRIAEKYILDNDKNTSIKIHILDCVIKTACASFKSSLTNYIEGYAGMFKVRYWSNNRQKKVMEIEPIYIKDGFICKNVFGPMMMMKCTSSNKWEDYKLNTKKAIKLHYDAKTETYSLFVPRDEITVKSPAESGSFVGVDPGVCKFMSCISNDKAIQFGTNIYRKIVEILKKIDANNESDLTQDIKNKRNTKHYKRIANMIDDMHWKVISNLTDNYERIYIGKLNMKDVVSNVRSNISDMTKRVGLLMRHYQFRQRLIFKCKSKRISCIEVDEKYTSKTCSMCGAYKGDLGGSRIYNCDKCGRQLDRDMNGSRDILLKNTN